MVQVCDALAYLHAQQPPVIHRDIKPANIRVTPEGKAMLVDFGIAKVYQPKLKTTLGARAFTPGFSPYEQYGSGVTDVRTDLYALGATLYTLLTGQDPPESLQRVVRDPLKPANQVNPAVSREMADIAWRALQMDPEQRYQRASDFKKALKETSAADSIFRPGINPRRWQAPWRWLTGLLLVALIFVLVGLSISGGLPGPGDPPPGKTELAGEIAFPTTPATLPASPSGVVRSPSPVTPSLSPAADTAEPTSLPWKYVVRPGDTCSGIAQRFEITLRTIVELNNLPEDCNQLFAGQTLLLPASAAALGSTPGDSLTIATRTAEVDGMIQVYIPEGVFLMGSADDQPAEADERPQHSVYLDAFWIDLTEVTNAMYARCVSAGGCREPAQISSKTRLFYYSDSRFANYPVIYVSWQDANTYCQWAGRRLPTEAEWEKAARGADGRFFPWGDAPAESNRLNYNQHVGDTTPVGSYPTGASSYGVLDMAGNVAEWVADWYDASYYAVSTAVNPLGPGSGQYRVLRGGSWFSPEQVVRAVYRLWNLPDLGYDSSGFRCAAVP